MNPTSRHSIRARWLASIFLILVLFLPGCTASSPQPESRKHVAFHHVPNLCDLVSTRTINEIFDHHISPHGGKDGHNARICEWSHLTPDGSQQDLTIYGSIIPTDPEENPNIAGKKMLRKTHEGYSSRVSGLGTLAYYDSSSLGNATIYFYKSNLSIAVQYSASEIATKQGYEIEEWVPKEQMQSVAKQVSLEVLENLKNRPR